jgi:chemotaxis protein CheX
LGEIANLVGGNIKSLLPGTNLLSLPTVVDGKQLQAKLPGTEGALILRVPLRSAGHQFAVSLLSKKNMAA